jgi:predicted RNA-binding protein with PIN domain
MRYLYIDAMNVIGSRPDGWWRDLDAAVRRLADDLQAYAATLDAQVVLVADGRPIADLPEGRHGSVDLRYAARAGRDAADDRIAELVAAIDGREDVEVVTADRDLRDRVLALGAPVTGPRHLLDEVARHRPATPQDTPPDSP